MARERSDRSRGGVPGGAGGELRGFLQRLAARFEKRSAAGAALLAAAGAKGAFFAVGAALRAGST